ncbi:enoyl-CoA hydratase [Virgibacillus sp. NKC19-3]|nr:enoyl-CoA hydratase [Virgibacillus sp. NKC19-3]
MIGKKRKLGKAMGELQIGDTYRAIKKIEDKDLLLYLGLTDDANPLYIQHDYASQTPYKQPIVPSVMVFGMVSSIISMHLPGPGSHITQHEMIFPNPVLHDTEVTLTIEIIAIDEDNHKVAVSVIGFDKNGFDIVSGKLYVSPPSYPNTLTANSLDNFF